MRKTIEIAGDVILTLGALTGLLFVYVVWWTDVEAENYQAEIKAEESWIVSVPESISEVPTAQDEIKFGQKRYDDPPIMAKPTKYAETMATMLIPRFGSGYERTVHNGTDKKIVLDKLGIGWLQYSQLPGEVGNFAVSGHRTTYGKPFNKMAELKQGDKIIVRTPDVWYVYQVSVSPYIVTPQDIQVVAPVPGDRTFSLEPTSRVLTLTACHPMFSARERIITHAIFDHWVAVDDGLPEALYEELS